MKNIFIHTKRLFKKVKKLQESLKKAPPVEKFEFPDTEEEKGKKPMHIVEISTKSVAKATLTIIGIIALAYFVYSIKTLLILFFVSLFFAAAMDPAVDWLENKHIPRSIGVILIFLILIGIVVVVIGSMIPIIVEQISSLVSNFTNATIRFFESLKDNGDSLAFLPEKYRDWVITTLQSMKFETIIKQLLNNLSGIVDQVQNFASGSLKTIGSTLGAGVSVTVSIASGLFNFILVLFLTFFMAIDKGSLNDFFHSLFPKKYGSYISEKTGAIQKQIGSWFRGQILLSIIMFITTFIGLIIIGMGEYALILALIMAIGEFIPYIGPIIFFVFALPISFGVSFAVVIKLVIFAAILQFVEGNVFVPAVMNKVVGLSPIVVLLALIIGFQFLGIIGAIIAVPVTTAVAIFIKDYMKSVANKK